MIISSVYQTPLTHPRLESIEGDWHEFESKALRRERDKEARRQEYQREREKRKAASSAPSSERETKRVKQDVGEEPQPAGQTTAP